MELRHKGKGLIESAIEAGELRLRPIVMTSLAFILGTLPLMLASGAGANSRHSIGTGIVGGMIGATTLALFYVPMFYVILSAWPSAGKIAASEWRGRGYADSRAITPCATACR